MKKVTTLLACLSVSFLLPVLLSGADLRLLDAVRKGDRDAVRELLRNHAEVNVAQPDGSTPLLLAADRGDAEIAGLLIRAGAKVNARNDYGASPLYAACATGNIATEDLVSMLHEMGIETGIRLPALLEASREVQSILGRPLGSHLLSAGPVQWN